MESESAAVGSIFGEHVDVVRRYAEWLVGAGVERGLIGPREADRIWSRHILNCAVIGALMPDSAAVVDVGSGAGLPGIPLAIARPDLRVTLVEPLERRADFLHEVVAALELSNVVVLRGRADEVVDQCGEADVVTSRAVAPLAKLASWSVPLTRVGGQLLAMKGSSAAAEIERDRVAVARVGLIDLSVVEVGQGLVDPPTIVIRGSVVATKKSRRRKRS